MCSHVITLINKMKNQKFKQVCWTLITLIGAKGSIQDLYRTRLSWQEGQSDDSMLLLQRRAAPWAGSSAGVGGWEMGAGRRTWGRDCHLLDSIFKPLPAQPCTGQGTAEQAAFVVQAPDKLFRDRQAEDAVARTRVAHPALCKLIRTEASESAARDTASPYCYSTRNGQTIKVKGFLRSLAYPWIYPCSPWI